MENFNISLFKVKLRKDLIIILLIIILPFVFYFYNFIPETKVWSNKWIEFDSGYFNDANLFIWFLCVKFMTLIILSLWFLTIQFRWKYILFIPMLIEIYKISNLFRGLKFGLEIDTYFSKSLYFSIPYILVMLTISILIDSHKNQAKQNSFVNNEINNQIIKVSKFDTRDYKLVKKELKELEVQQQNMDKKEYLTKLIILRDRLSITN